MRMTSFKDPAYQPFSSTCINDRLDSENRRSHARLRGGSSMSTQNSWNYREGAWEIRDGQIIASFAQTPWVIQPADIEYLQYQYDTLGVPPSIDVWLKARANGQIYHVGRYPANNYNFASALTGYAGRNGIQVHNSGTTQSPQTTQPMPAGFVNQPGYAPQQGHVPQPGYAPQQGYVPQPGYAPQQGYVPQPGYAPQQGYVPQPGYAPRQGVPPQPGSAPRQGNVPQQPRPGNRPSHRRKKSRPGLVFAGLFLIVIAIAITSTSADKTSAAPLVILGIVLLLISSASRKRRGGNGTRTDDYDNTDYGYTDRDNDGIDDRDDNDSGSGNDSDDNDSDSGGDD